MSTSQEDHPYSFAYPSGLFTDISMLCDDIVSYWNAIHTRCTF